ncbi:MAG TPA: hypothetical protein VMZ27_09105, partial [Candidatus Saccharimonadales bacterium]|nr:hypothetical protein [Candidatus Saccharimonadales bacterium]
RNRSSAIEMSIITWGELAGGFESSAEMDNLFRGARILHLHVQVAWEASRIERELRDQGGNSEKTTIGSQRPPEYGDCGWYHETRPLPGFQIWI